MSGTVPDRAADERKEAVRRATDLVALVERTLPLRRSGRSFSACCPFHSERTPSFHVWPESQRWKCFSCSRSGDAFSFVMEREGVEFPEALRMLAREAGIEIDRPDPSAAAAARSKEAAYAACDFACRWFQGNLKGSPAADYLRGRGLDGAVAREWRLGYAPDRWDGLLAAGRAAGLGVPALEAAGLVVPRKGGDGFYDRFRNRVIFPIADPQGRVVGFGARALGDEEPKYLNSPDSALFRKGALLFGLDRAREEGMRTRTLAVMEGYMDVVMAHQHGFKAAVAGLGTAFTPEHASLLRRFADRVVLVYDTDAAGRRAADRALDALLASEIDARVAVLPEGKDPCELLVNRGPEPLRAALDGAREVFEHLLAETAAHHDLATVAGRTAAADAMLRTVNAVPNGVRRGLMIDRVGGMFGLSETEVRRRARAIAPAAAPAQTTSRPGPGVGLPLAARPIPGAATR
ncbi:MAG TPA: DNA primase, partial [Planctomycetota bacterium]|nr:DNA primase [Planctomycetota bacterium]